MMLIFSVFIFTKNSNKGKMLNLINKGPLLIWSTCMNKYSLREKMMEKRKKVWKIEWEREEQKVRIFEPKNLVFTYVAARTTLWTLRLLYAPLRIRSLIILQLTVCARSFCSCFLLIYLSFQYNGLRLLLFMPLYFALAYNYDLIFYSMQFIIHV